MEIQNNLKELELELKKQELDLRGKELAVKIAEARNSAHEMHNTYLRETRGRADGLVRAVLLISGGSLTLSLNAFLREHPIQLAASSMCQLKWAWGLLFTAMVCAILVPLSLIIGARFHGIRWREYLNDPNPKEPLKQPKYSDALAWIFGLTSIAACCVGLLLLARIAVGTLSS